MLNNNKYNEWPLGRKRRRKDTGVLLIIDESGSMSPRREETIREFNRYLDKLRGDGLPYFLTVTTFDTNTHTLLRDMPIREVGNLERSEYDPEGWTALHDAVVETLRSVRSRSNNICVVITDGEENSSRNYGLTDVRNAIDDKKRAGNWEFVFLGSGPDSWRTGRNMGFVWNVATDYTVPTVMPDMYKSLYTVTNTTATTGAGTVAAFQLNTNSTKAQKSDE